MEVQYQVAQSGIPPQQQQQQQQPDMQQQVQQTEGHTATFVMDTGGGAGVQQVGLSCADCQLNLTGHRYIVKDEKPHCIKCYEQIYSNECFSCKQKIGTDAKVAWDLYCFLKGTSIVIII